MADILGHSWMKGPVLNKQQFDAKCREFMTAALAEKASANEEFGIDHAVEKAPTRRGVEEFKREEYVTRPFRPYIKNSMNSTKTFTMTGKPIEIMGWLHEAHRGMNMQNVKLSKKNWKMTMEGPVDTNNKPEEYEPEYKIQVELHEIKQNEKYGVSMTWCDRSTIDGEKFNELYKKYVKDLTEDIKENYAA